MKRGRRCFRRMGGWGSELSGGYGAQIFERNWGVAGMESAQSAIETVVTG
jgi:hypothetical protein